MTTTPKRNNKLVAWAAGAAVAAAAAPTLLLFAAGPAQADDGGMLNAANAQRAKDGCPAWASNPALQAAAQSHADDVLKNGTTDGHTGSDGSTPASRATANGWTGSPAGEIEASGGPGPAKPTDVAPAAIAGWMSDGHRLAFSDCKTTDAGSAVATDSTGWVAVITAATR
jgi:uncharacterized protein YkwD